MNAQQAVKTVDVAVTLVGSCFLVWMLMPPALKLELARLAQAEWDKLNAPKRRRAIERQMQFEMMWALATLEEYDIHRDPDQLAHDLAA